MSVNAKFVADFSSFSAAVQKADLELRSFEADANKVGPALNRMVDQFSGRKLISEATMMARVLGDSGSLARLTGNELRVAGGKAAEAAEKMRKMGVDVPPGLQRIADAVKSGESAFGSFGKQIVATAAGFVTAQAILNGFKTVIRAVADEFKTLTVGGAAVADVGENFDRLAANAGHLGDVLLGTLRAGTHSTIADFELMKTVNKDLAAGMNLTDQQFGTLAKGAFALAQATGGDVKTALDTMNDAMLTGRTRSLAMLTGKIDLTAAEEKFARAIGTTANHLSEEGKLEAARAGILDAVSAATERLGEQTDGLDERVAQAQVAWANFENTLGRSIATSSSLGDGLDALQTSLTQAFGGNQDALIQNITKSVEAAAGSVVNLGLATIEMARVVHVAWSAVSTAVLGAITGMIKSAEAMLAAISAVAKVGEIFGQVQKGTSQWASSVRQDLKGVSDSLAAQTIEAARGVVGMSALDKQFDAMGGVLFRVKDAMGAASKETTAFVGPLRDLASGHDAASAAAGRHRDLTKQIPAELVKAEAEAVKAAKALRDYHNAIGVQFIKDVEDANTATANTAKSLRAFNNEMGVQEIRDIENTAKATADVAAAMRDLDNALGVLDMEARAHEFAFVGPIQEDLIKQTKTWQEGLSDLASTMVQMAQVSGDSFGGILKDLAQIVVAMDMAAKSAQQFKAAQASGSKMGMATGAVGMASSMMAATGSKSTLQNVTGGAMTGAAIGTMIMPGLGTAVGAIAGGFIGLARSIKKVGEEEKEARKEVQEWTSAFESTLTSAQRLEAATAGWEGAGLLVGVRDAFKDAGLSAAEAEAAVKRLWDATREGAAATAAAQADIQKVIDFNKAVVDAIHAAGYVSQKDLEDLAETAKNVYERMLRDGTYSAEQLDKAWGASLRAQAVAMGEAWAVGQDAAESAGFQIRAQLEVMADDARRNYEYMRDSGVYTAQQVSDAWEASAKASGLALEGVGSQAAAAGFKTKAQLEKTAQDAEAMYLYIRDSGLFTASETEKAWANAFGSLEDLYGDLQRPGERSEDTIKRTRADFDAANAQLSASSIAATAATAAEQGKILKDQMDTQTEDVKAQAEEAAQSLKEALAGIHPSAIHVPIIFDIPNLPGGGRVEMPQAGGVVPFAQPAGRSGGGGTAVLEVDGRVLASVTVPHLPGAVQRYGLGKR